jgi:hypothetical protein
VNSSGGKEVSPSKISLIRAGRKDLAPLAQFSKKMRRNNIKLLPFKERELFEKYRVYGENSDGFIERKKYHGSYRQRCDSRSCF